MATTTKKKSKPATSALTFADLGYLRALRDARDAAERPVTPSEVAAIAKRELATTCRQLKKLVGRKVAMQPEWPRGCYDITELGREAAA